MTTKTRQQAIVERVRWGEAGFVIYFIARFRPVKKIRSDCPTAYRSRAGFDLFDVNIVFTKAAEIVQSELMVPVRIFDLQRDDFDAFITVRLIT